MPRRPGGPAPPTRHSHRTSGATDELIALLRSDVVAFTGRAPRTDALIAAAFTVARRHVTDVVNELPPA